MRPRFSIRALLVLVFVIAIACYAAFVRPVAIARAFAKAVESKNYRAAEGMCHESNRFITKIIDDGKIQSVEVEVESANRKWHHYLKLQQPLVIRLIREPRPETTDQLVYQADLLATFSGIKPGDFYVFTRTRR